MNRTMALDSKNEGPHAMSHVQASTGSRDHAKDGSDRKQIGRGSLENHKKSSAQAAQSADHRQISGLLSGESIQTTSTRQPGLHAGALGGPKPGQADPQLNSSNNMGKFMAKNALPMSKFHNKILIPSSGGAGQPGPPIAPTILGATPNFQSSQNHQDNYQIGPGGPPSQASMIHSIGGHWQKARHQ